MSFYYEQNNLFGERVDLGRLAKTVGTPCFVYSTAKILEQWEAYETAFRGRKHLVCYAVKANDNLSLLTLLKESGAGYDIVSVGELNRVLAIGGEMGKVVFSGVGKTQAEIEEAVCREVGCINVESEPELQRIGRACAESGRKAQIAFRVNPNVDARTHPYISTGLRESKFGVSIESAVPLYRKAISLGLKPVGIACHVGSQITSLEPIVESVKNVVELAKSLSVEGIDIKHIDVGGGLGIQYQNEMVPSISSLVQQICDVVPAQFEIRMEPGRSMVGSSGVLLAKVEYLKKTPSRNFVIIDAAMNDFLRPAFYDAWHRVVPCRIRDDRDAIRCDVVGPVCETGDWLALDRTLSVQEGDYLCICDAGAYGAVMSSNYNSRLKAAEVLIDGETYRTIRSRETVEEMLANESQWLFPSKNCNDN